MGARMAVSSLLPLLAALVLAGCAADPVREARNTVRNLSNPFGKSQAQRTLEDGILDYEEGQYMSSARKLRVAIDEGLRPSDRITAHKYLAFISCVSNRESQCREEFRRALQLDARFELSPAEAGHPIWGPVFRNLKAYR